MCQSSFEVLIWKEAAGNAVFNESDKNDAFLRLYIRYM